MRNQRGGFTLTELLVAISIVTAVVLLVTRLFNSATIVTTTGSTRIDADSQFRPLADRMAIDFSQIVRRPDVDFFLKSPANPQGGNDQMAFFSTVAGYYPSTGSASPFSVVGYRVSSEHQLQRFGKGLLWNGVSTTSSPIVFLPLTIGATWPTATSGAADPDYEPIAPQVVRFEYSYLLKRGVLDDTPWDTALGHTSVSGLQDVAGISVVVAMLNPKTRGLLSPTQVETLTGRLPDFVPGLKPGDLSARWQAAIDGITDMPRPALQSARVYERCFYIAPR